MTTLQRFFIAKTRAKLRAIEKDRVISIAIFCITGKWATCEGAINYWEEKYTMDLEEVLLEDWSKPDL